MKKLYLLLILLFFALSHINAQTFTETFEGATNNSATFTSNSKTFNLTSPFGFTVGVFPGLGYNASSTFIQVSDPVLPGAMGQTGVIAAASGTFKVSSFWLFISGNAEVTPGVTNGGGPGSVTFRGKLAGATVFTVVRNTTGGNTGLAFPGNGFTVVNLATEGGSDNSNQIIDQLEIQLSSNYDYFAIDNFAFANGAVAPTVTSTAATNIKSVSATLGGNVTADGGDATIERGIVWATTANPTIANNKFQIGTGTGVFNNVVTGLPAATTIHYRAYAINSGGTNYGADLTFTTGAALNATISKTNVSCNGGTNGTATITPTGGSPTYTYSWAPSGGTNATAVGLGVGVYTVTITDNEGTQITRSTTITQPTVLNATPSVTNVACNGGSNGTATITPTGGSPTYTYLWNTGATTQSITGLTTGTYSVTVTDANSCTKTINNIIVSQPLSAISGTTSSTPVSCFGGTNGTATVSASGGTPSYTYSWSPSGGTAATATGLAAGTYSVTITDANACTQTINGIVVGGPAAALSGTPSSTNVSCNGGSNGTASVTASGGTPSYTYSWSPSGGTAATATGLIAGTYSVTITDSKGCTATVSGIVVGQPSAALNGTPSSTNVSCNGGSNGTATITPTGGTSPYTYIWSNGGTSSSITGLLAGVYSVTITDANACSRTINNILVTQPSVLNATPSLTNVSCNGGSNGSATVTGSGGTTPYTYLWSNGATTASITGLTIGTYSVTVTDANSCIKTINNITITQPPVLDGTPSTTSVSCNGGSNGTATILASGGTPSYTYSWSPSGGTAATATGLTAGTYSVTITDANACSKTISGIVVGQPTALVATASAQTNILCNSSATGSATVSATGGTGAYTYSWSPTGGTAATATGLTAGTYTVTVTDANACSTTQSFTITQPAALTATASAQTNIACNGGTTGSATVSVTGGTGAYTYSWSPSGGTAATATGLAAGNYTVTVTDANLCTTTQSFNITQPTALAATTSSTSVSCFGGSNGTASVTVSGGTPAYTYAWAPLGGNSATVTGRPAGNYTCTITDANGCTLVKNITIGSPAAFSATYTKTDVSCNGGTNGSATITATGATSPYTYTWTPTGGSAATASGLAAGNYTVLVQDANTCVYTVNITIDQPSALTATTSQTNVLCNGGATGTATVVASGGTTNYTYVWSPSGGTAATATGLTAGNYTCTITDSNGCFVSKSFTIMQPSILAASTSQINATCSTGGQAAVNVSGGTTPYSYLWSNGATTQVVTGLLAGNYSAVITDGNGCTLTKNFTIGTTNTLIATTSQTNVLCNGSNTGTATVTPSGAPGPFTYAWAPFGGNTDTATNLTAGNYSVTITSANGCSIVKNFTITEPTAINITPLQTNLLCNGGVNGSATVVVTGGTGAYTYSWSPSGGTGATATGLSAGTYTVTVTDANLCTKTQSFTITQPTAIAATTSQTNVSCNGGSNGSATVNVTGGTGAYTYSWSPSGGTAATATGLAAGTYTVTITDANLCTTTAAVTITQPTALTATTVKTDVSCNGANDGTATVTATGGTGSYTYSWSPSGGTAATAAGLSPNTYTVTITDANACSLTQTVTIGTTPDVTAPVPTVAVLPEISNYCAVLASQITIPTAIDNCVGTLNATTTDPLTYNTVGTYTITWKYDDGNGNTTTQLQTVKVLASPINVVTFANAQATYDGNAHPLQVANLPTGATVTYSANNSSVNAGTYTVTATITPAASSPNCSPVTLTANLVINKAAQVITFNALPIKTLGANNTFNLTAVSSSGLPVDYIFSYVSTLAPANVSATGLVNMLRSGQVTITARQAGDANYLAAANVSQTLIILNNNIDVKRITLGTKVFENPGKTINYVMSCSENNPAVSIVNESNAVITPSANFTIQTPKPGIYSKDVTITSEDGSLSAVYSITVEKPFGFFDIVRQKFNNVLIVNNNPLTNGGYEFTAYQWFKNGQLIGTGQYYSASESLSSPLDPTADYSVKMTTKDGKVLQTCTGRITLTNSFQAKLYPNPIQTGKTITVEADYPQEELDQMQISLYSVTGQLIKTVQSSSVLTEIQLPQTTESNIIMVVLEAPNVKKSFKVIVK